MSCRLNEKTNRCSKTGTKKSILCSLNKETNRCFKRQIKNTIKKKQKSSKPKTAKNIDKKMEIVKDIKAVKAVKSVKSVKAVIKPKSNKTKKEQKNRKDLCNIPKNLEYISLLGQRGKEGETWKVRNKVTKHFYALKIFDKNKSKKNIDKEICYQDKLEPYGIAPILKWKPKDQNCFMMELIDGMSLDAYTKHKPITYTEDDVKQLYNIIISLYKSKVAYNDGNVKMNMMYSKKGQWKLIDYGMVMNETKVNQLAKKIDVTPDEYYLINAFNIILKVEEFIMKRLYGIEKYKYTPIGGVFKPSSSFPSLMKYVYHHNLVDKISLLNINKKMYYGPHKKYDETKRIGI